MTDINELVAALAKARKNFPDIQKTETATIKGKSKSGADFQYSYDYAPLSEIIDKTCGPLSDNGLVLFETIDETESGTELIVTIAHNSGQSQSSKKLIGTFNDPKEFGSAMTYYRRYLIEGLLNIASQQDKDAQDVSSKTTPRKQTKPAPTPNGNSKKSPDPMTEFWSTCKAYDLTVEQGREILENNGGDPVKALNAIEGHAQ